MEQANYNLLRLIFLLSALMGPLALGAQSLEELSLLPQEDFPKSSTVYWQDQGEPDLNLLPDMAGKEGLLSRFRGYKPEITVQKLYRIPLPRGYQEGVTARRALFSQVMNAFAKPESQVGYTYDSATRDRETVLFESSFISDEKGNPADPFVVRPEDLPMHFNYYQYVDEVNFSGTVLLQQLEANLEYLSFRSTNISRMWYAIIPVLAPEGTKNEMLMTTHGSWLYVYNTTQVKKEPTVKKLGVPLNLPSMFRKRMDVMAQWLTDQLQLELE